MKAVSNEQMDIIPRYEYTENKNFAATLCDCRIGKIWDCFIQGYGPDSRSFKPLRINGIASAERLEMDMRIDRSARLRWKGLQTGGL